MREADGEWEIFTRSEADRQKPITSYGLPLEPHPFNSHPPLDVISVTSAAIKELCESDHVSCTGEDGKASLEMVMGFHLSHRRSNTKVSLPLQGDDLLFELQIT